MRRSTRAFRSARSPAGSMPSMTSVVHKFLSQPEDRLLRVPDKLTLAVPDFRCCRWGTGRGRTGLAG